MTFDFIYLIHIYSCKQIALNDIRSPQSTIFLPILQNFHNAHDICKSHYTTGSYLVGSFLRIH